MLWYRHRWVDQRPRGGDGAGQEKNGRQSGGGKKKGSLGKSMEHPGGNIERRRGLEGGRIGKRSSICLAKLEEEKAVS